MSNAPRPNSDIVHWVGEAQPDGLRVGDYWNWQRVKALKLASDTSVVVEVEFFEPPWWNPMAQRFEG